jgi:hypothetical protein
LRIQTEMKDTYITIRQCVIIGDREIYFWPYLEYGSFSTG